MPKPMQNILLIALISLTTTLTYGQGIKVVGGAHLKVSGSLNVKITGNNGGFTLDNNSNISVENSSTLLLTGNFTLNSGETDLAGSVAFIGDRPQAMSANSQILLSNLTINKTGNNLTLQSPVLVSRNLNLVRGNINSSATNLLTLGPRKVFSSGSSDSYVNGPLAIQTVAELGSNYAFTFPVGEDDEYGPIIAVFTQSDAVSTTYTVEIPTSNIPPHSLSNDLEKISDERYWKVSNGNQNNFSDAEITLPITADDEIGSANAVIARSDGTQWINIGGTDISVPGTVTSTVEFTSWGDFVIGAKQDVALAPTFTLLPTSVTELEDFTEVKSVVVQPDPGTPEAGYTFSSSNTELVDISLVDKTISITARPNQFGEADVTITATATNNSNNTATKILPITITPVNDPPVVTTNTELVVPKASSGSVSQNRLEVTDLESGPESITYTLVTSPAHGTLEKNAVTISSDDTFTQQDINLGVIRYTHDGSESSSDTLALWHQMNPVA